MTEVAPNKETIVVKLLKHYVPMGEYEVVGHDRPEITAKDAAGRQVIKQEAAFIAGEMYPAPYPGVGFENKIWAGTHIRLPRDEAKKLYDARKAERPFEAA